ncbi:molybdopterin-containing oxidoreductase family protein [Desulfoferrobacter suflitae]|uniref:molybdopterin-containing oxidoreductase family protein n=1 Tax=Desulfoferrobacter suflitae TaxID=2865782 RepID=UPI00216436EB|nr:molybdopterin-dependent oxidoreductase [Desulfoferrobacter suflitae]MCK8601608.1 molybdopterin-dependent oxidoreductase [Desulfoferrobacter suflitae]
MSEATRWVKTHCARMDHGGCSLLVGVKENRIVQVKGDPEGFLNKGYTCHKGRVSADRLTHPDRLKYPLKRAGGRGEGKWQRITWDQALDETAEALLRIKDQYGARAVGFGVGMPKGLEHFVQIRLANIFGSPNVIASQDVCHAPREITGVHTCGFYPVADLHNPTNLMLVWASNLTSSNEEGQINSLALQQLKNGAKLIVVDPRRTLLAEKADLWLQLRPGTSAALALAMLHVIIQESLYDAQFVENYTYGFEDLAEHVKHSSPEAAADITWVPADLIRRAARMYAAAKPAALQWGNAIERDINTFDVSRSLICLMALCGYLETAGGNINAHDPRIMGLGEFVRADLIPNKRKEMISAYHKVIPRLMTIAPAYFRKAVLEGIPYPVRGYFGICSNPLVTWADSRLTYRAFTDLEFVAVADLFMTPTVCMADLVFPVAHQFEMNDIGHYGIGHGMILARPKVVDPPGECWPDMKVMNELGKRISPPEYWPDDHEQFLADVLKPSALTYAEFVAAGYLKGPERFKLYEEKGFRTPTGKVELKLSTADKFKLKPLPEFPGLPEEEDPAYPLLMISAKSKNYLHSSYRWLQRLRDKEPRPLVEIHPETAAAHGISDGDQVAIATRFGEICQWAKLTDAVHPSVINAAIGWWFPEGDPQTQYEWRKSNLNMLTSVEKLGREFATPNLKNLPCRIRKK